MVQGAEALNGLGGREISCGLNEFGGVNWLELGGGNC
jgi:hypothetical protein